MHSGFARPRALQGVNAHQARVSNPEPSHAFFAARDDLAAALEVCTLERAAFRWRSRGAVRTACGEAAVDRGGVVDTCPAVTPDSAPGACRASGFTQSATGSGRGCNGCSAADGAGGAAVATVVTDTVAAAVADGVPGAAGAVTIGASTDVASTFGVVASFASSVESGSPDGGNGGRSRVQAPQPSATMPVSASEATTLR